MTYLHKLVNVGFVATALSFATLGSAFAQTVKLSTSEGDIVVQLDAAKAPKTVENFVQYVKSGHYNGTVFHRVIKTFMIQGGGMTPNLKEKPTRPPIQLESKNGLTNQRGTIAMARTAAPNSATAQFFINVKDNAFLDADSSEDGNGYAVFGRVIQGMDVVDRIRNTKTGPGGKLTEGSGFVTYFVGGVAYTVKNMKGEFEDVPTTPIIIKQATLEK